MKKILALGALSLICLNVQAARLGEYTTAEFQIVKVSPMCPAPAPGEMGCQAMGGKVVVETTLDCLDSLLFTHFEEVVINGKLTIQAVSVVKRSHKKVMCFVANTIRKEIVVKNLNSRGEVELINEEIR